MTTPSAYGVTALNHFMQRAIFELRRFGFISEDTRQQLSPSEYQFALTTATNYEAIDE